MLALLFSVQSIASVQATSFAIPIAQLYYDAVGRRLTLMCLTVVALAQFMAAVTAFTASSRLYYALARDNAFPMKQKYMALNRYQAPYWGVWTSVLIGCIISCAYIGSAVAVRLLHRPRVNVLMHDFAVQRDLILGCHRGNVELSATYHHPRVLAQYLVSSIQIMIILNISFSSAQIARSGTLLPRTLVLVYQSCELLGTPLACRCHRITLTYA